MSETTQQGTGQGTSTSSAVSSTSIINRAIEAVMDLIDALGLYSTISRGALGTGNGICCEIGPSGPDEVYLDKNQHIVIDLTINGKHTNLQTLSDAMNSIHESLTFKKEYPYDTDWRIMINRYPAMNSHQTSGTYRPEHPRGRRR